MSGLYPCPKCNGRKTYVENPRAIQCGHVRRTRFCPNQDCRHRFTTVELPLEELERLEELRECGRLLVTVSDRLKAALSPVIADSGG